MTVAAFTVLTVWCAVACAIDLRRRRLPNSLTLVGAAGVAGYAMATDQPSVALLGAGLLATPYLLVHLAAPAALGAGDVKLAVGLGGAAACAGAQAWVWAALAAPILTAAVGAIMLAIRRGRDDRAGPQAVPHGPGMCVATLAALVAVR